MRRQHVTAFIAGGLLLAGLLAAPALAEGGRRARALLASYEEVPAISSTARGAFLAEIDAAGEAIHWELRYDELEGAVTQAHIHLGQRSVNGSIMVFLCSNLGNGPVGTPECPEPPAIITGTITPDDVGGGAAGQGVAAGEFGELLRAMAAGVTYVNVHSDLFPGGEIRGQVRFDQRRLDVQRR